MKVDILTIFPDYFSSPFEQSLLAKAKENGLFDCKIWNIRDFANDKHKTVDDTPYGGGAGMVMKVEPIYNCLNAVKKQRGDGYKILTTPRGRLLSQTKCFNYSKKGHLIIICGRYEGVDERVLGFVDDEISIGDYVVMGGECAALVLVESSLRLAKGVIGKEESYETETFSDGLLEYPQYTRPADFNGLTVPPVLISGDHKKVEKWRKEQALTKTVNMRPDLLEKKGKGN